MEYIRLYSRRIPPNKEDLVKALKDLHRTLLRSKLGLKRFKTELDYKMWKPDTKFSEWMSLYKPRVKTRGDILEFSINNSLWEYLAFDLKYFVHKYGYYIAKEKTSVSYKVVELHPNYGERVKTGKYVYHLTPSENVDRILRKGLVPRADKKLEDYPPRIYLVQTLEDVSKLIPAFLSFGLNPEDVYYDGDHNDLSILRVDTTKFKANYYKDTQSNGIWSYSWIPPKAITLESN